MTNIKNINSFFYRTLIVVILAGIFLFACGSTESNRKTFVEQLDRSIGRNVDEGDLWSRVSAKDFNQNEKYIYKFIKRETKTDGTHYIYEHKRSHGCTFAKVIRDNKVINWYYMSDPKKCYVPLNFGGS